MKRPIFTVTKRNKRIPVYQWCHKNCQDEFAIGFKAVYFQNEQDAIMFSLKFGG